MSCLPICLSIYLLPYHPPTLRTTTTTTPPPTTTTTQHHKTHARKHARTLINRNRRPIHDLNNLVALHLLEGSWNNLTTSTSAFCLGATCE
ncbi:hypothetical protein F5Y10DRAFT_234513 [Nemania abortiva]|nr:hypothetical protein F5Y10DRAFT_234513 [Nemania abortiva]